ncbi:MAG TPA: hypothetical protein VIL86_11090 [Tepidisphaeraceae bacterium]|jgi:hypothetical protein
MILLDTSVLVRYLRTSSPAIREVLASTDCAICGVTRAEILHGARTPQDSTNLCTALDAFLQIPIEPPIWDLLWPPFGIFARERFTHAVSGRVAGDGGDQSRYGTLVIRQSFSCDPRRSKKSAAL